MKAEKEKKELSFGLICEDLKKVEASKSGDVKKISDIFGRIQDVKNIENSQIGELFNESVNKLGSYSWLFLLDIYARFYNRNKIKKSFVIIRLIKSETEKRLNSIVSKEEMNQIIMSIKADEGLVMVANLIDRIKGSVSENTLIEIISYLYLLVLIRIKDSYVYDFYEISKRFERVLFSKLAVVDKSDPLFIKGIKKAINDGKYGEKFKELTYLCDGLTEEIQQLTKLNSANQEVIYSKKEEIRAMKEEISNYNNQLLEKTALINQQKSELESKEKEIEKVNNNLEYLENLYQQQFATLKRGLVEKIKKELKLEIEGIEDIADSLSDIQREKIQRRITRICKIIERVGE
ncbi:MAG: hypothetical protein J6C23_01775 [Clostridia bacterium]|nr:hypothetical protein [Clostridia bacterium]